MQFIFTKIAPTISVNPSAGEIYLIPSVSNCMGRRDLSLYVLEQGVAGIMRGTGAPERFILPAEPTFDDMLAMTFVFYELQNRALPSNAVALARYAALIREGLRPSTIPLELSIEGIYLAIRNNAGEDLTDENNAKKFIDDWFRMSDILMTALESGKDPFEIPIFDKGHEFARERAFLREDKNVYTKDVEKGEKWSVTLPGSSPNSSALILNQPKSLLWKYWSRQDSSVPGGMYLFLGVTLKPFHWVFSTDPVQRISLQDLTNKLQKLELRKNPDKARERNNSCQVLRIPLQPYSHNPFEKRCGLLANKTVSNFVFGIL